MFRLERIGSSHFCFWFLFFFCFSTRKTMGDYCCYDILKNDTYGRFAVASKDFQPGDLIVSELPFTYGPKSDSPPVCLGCHCRVDGRTLCSSCGWPVCNDKCEIFSIHADNECLIFSEAKTKFRPVEDLTRNCPQYECIMPLRVLLTKERDEEKWRREIQSMESHEDERKKTDLWRVEGVNVAGFLHKVCKLQERFSDELIHFVCGILEVNAFVAPNTSGFEVRCLYPRASLLTHSCIPNVGHYIFSNSGNDVSYRIYVRAVVKIRKGEELLLTYTQTLSPTLFRRAHLKEGKYFDCSCRRCADPTESETNLSTLRCTKCCKGYVLSTNPLDETAPWHCTSCEFMHESEEVKRMLFSIQKEAEELSLKTDDPIACREAFIEKYQQFLHSNHAIIMGVKCSLSQLYGSVDGYLLKDLPDALLERKINLCHEINKISAVIKPGISRQRGWNLYELYAPIILLAKRQLRQNKINERNLRVKFEEAARYLEELVIIFSYEDPESSEGITGKSASRILKELNTTIKAL